MTNSTNLHNLSIMAEDAPIIFKYIGHEICRIRRERNLSGFELGQKVGFSQQQVSRYECGLTRMDITTLIFFLYSLEISLNDFAGNVLQQLKIYEPDLYLKYAFIFPTYISKKNKSDNRYLAVEPELRFD